MDSGYVYIAEAVGTGFFKIGMTVNVRSRIKGLQTACPYPIRLVHAVSVSNLPLIEKDFHAVVKQYRVIGEWFELPKDVVKRVVFLMSLPHVDESDVRAEIIKSLDLSVGLEPLPLLTINGIEPQQVLPATTEQVQTISPLDPKLSTDELMVEKIADYQKMGMNQTQIVFAIWGCRKGGSIAYQSAVTEYKRLTQAMDIEG